MKVKDLPVGALVRDKQSTYNGQPIVFRIIGQNHPDDPEDSTTIMADRILTLKAFDAAEPDNKDEDRREYGNNRYDFSNLLRWLNSDAAAGRWYNAMHSADTAPSKENVWRNPYDDEAGFLNGFSENMKNALLVSSKIVKIPCEKKIYERIESLMFLLSAKEVGFDMEGDYEEGTRYEYFNTAIDRLAIPTKEAVERSEYESERLSETDTWYYWLRTPDASYSCSVRYVYSDGTLDDNLAYNGYSGVRPACSIKSSTSVSDKPDENGVYELFTESTRDGVSTENEEKEMIIEVIAKNATRIKIILMSLFALITGMAIQSNIERVSTTAYAQALTNDEIKRCIMKDTELTDEELSEEEKYDEYELLAACVEAEAGNQGFDGKRMVADVILNRVDDDEYPDTITGVITDKYEFTSYWNGAIDNVVPSEETYKACDMELRERGWPGLFFFNSKDYSKYGKPWKKVGDHYFSTKKE